MNDDHCPCPRPTHVLTVEDIDHQGNLPWQGPEAGDTEKVCANCTDLDLSNDHARESTAYGAIHYSIKETGMSDSIKFHGLEVLEVCPDLWLISCYGSGDNAWSTMINAVAETFGPEEYGAATHLHFYANRKEAEKIWGEIDIPDTIKTVSFIRNYEETEMTDSIKSEQYFGKAWKRATPEQKAQVLNALGINQEDTMKDTTCQAPVKNRTCLQNATADTGGIGTCRQPAHLEWAKEELERRMQEFVEAQDKEPEMKDKKKTSKHLSQNDVIMLRRIYRGMERMHYPKTWLNRVQQIAEAGTREEMQKLYIVAKRRNLV